jgi:hypothetical protein
MAYGAYGEGVSNPLKSLIRNFYGTYGEWVCNPLIWLNGTLRSFTSILRIDGALRRPVNEGGCANG